MRKESITQAELKELFSYDPETGVFTRLSTVGGKRAGSIAGCKHHSGYIYIMINEREYGAHRLAWLYVHGALPLTDLDHINGVRDDNRIANLRLANKQLNAYNRRTNSNSTTGLPGIGVHKASGKYSARISHNGNDIWLGVFDTIEAAWEARVKAKKEFHSFSPDHRDADISTAVDIGLPSRDKYKAKPTGVKHVHHVPHNNTYKVVIRKGKGFVYLGYFKTIEEATAAVEEYKNA